MENGQNYLCVNHIHRLYLIEFSEVFSCLYNSFSVRFQTTLHLLSPCSSTSTRELPVVRPPPNQWLKIFYMCTSSTTSTYFEKHNNTFLPFCVSLPAWWPGIRDSLTVNTAKDVPYLDTRCVLGGFYGSQNGALDLLELWLTHGCEPG